MQEQKPWSNFPRNSKHWNINFFSDFGHFWSQIYPLKMMFWKTSNGFYLDQGYYVDFKYQIGFGIAPWKNRKTNPFLILGKSNFIPLFVTWLRAGCLEDPKACCLNPFFKEPCCGIDFSPMPIFCHMIRTLGGNLDGHWVSGAKMAMLGCFGALWQLHQK